MQVKNSIVPMYFDNRCTNGFVEYGSNLFQKLVRAKKGNLGTAR